MTADLPRAREHLRTIGAVPRPAGGPADLEAQEYAARVLGGAGFTVRREPFAYSAFPGRFATPLVGAGLVAAIAAAGHVGARGHGFAALAILVAAAGAAALLGRWLARDGVLDVPALRASATNLVALRGGAAPAVWLMAHTDTKSQPVPQAARAAGITGLSIVYVAALALAAAQAAGRTTPGFPPWIALAALAVLVGAPVVLSVVGNRSAGALDNASGVAAVLLAAERIPRDLPLGVVITSAEELGLAGARAWVRAHGAQPDRVTLNCDGVDDHGIVTTMTAGRTSAAVLGALREAAADSGIPYRAVRLVPGLLVDSVALTAAGEVAVTVSRGTLGTLRRVHTPGDTLEHLTGAGIPETAAVLAAAARRLAATPRGKPGAGERP